MSGAGLVEVAGYLPEASLSLEDVAEPLGLNAREVRRYRRFFGLDRVRWDPDARQADLLTAAARQLATLPDNRHRVRYVLHARTLEPTGPYSSAPLLETVRNLGLGHAQAFTVSQHACASGLLAVHLAGSLLAELDDPDALVLVLAGEKTYPHVARYMPAVMVMGESSSACLVGTRSRRDTVVAYQTATYGEYSEMTVLSAESVAAFEKSYVPSLADLIAAALAEAGIGLEDLRLILPHNVNRYSWTMLCKLLDIPTERVLLENIPVTGHCFCADPFINYRSAVESELIRPGDHYLMVSAGVGATFSALLVQH
ncbi:3-oxoacyl-[acyl-carrier-protein] synthase III C-terminal domain-containing protein [Actinospica robiniae]|uniref:3-oxoacyl-[acyl-carrier-protein] synthase III C-terminal domain-containing protein n=1 Tax=Actinospica robiniae TaxID=304901 RepID=UPI0005502A2F|nr:3-oxoacyl-[acyl-carrier-protein] synthase III C-terminal domain-containing protein [Actinospica robiniae]